MTDMDTKIYPFINDLVFKAIFGQQKNAKLLICLLNAILHRKGAEKIEAVEILNPFNLQEFETDKLTIVDLRAKTRHGEWFTIEVQVESEKSYVARSVYYLSKLYSSQLLEGDDFTKLARATGISITNFRLFPRTLQIQSVFRLKNVESGAELFDAFDLHYIELPKVAENVNVVPKTAFERWIHILKFSAHYCGSASLPEWAKQEEGIPMAVHELERVNADKLYRQLLETREKSDLVWRTRLAEARQDGAQEGIQKGIQVGRQEGIQEGTQKGIQVGRQEGRQEGVGELIRKMLGKGKTPEEVSELTEVSLQEVMRIAGEKQTKSHSKKVSEAPASFGGSKPRRTRKS